MASCQSSNKDIIVRKWQVESVDNPAQDSLFQLQLKSIDTISQMDSNMISYFNSSNLDSVKTAIKELMTKQKEEQTKQFNDYVKDVSMEFRKDSIMIQAVNGMGDSAKWFLADEKTIVIEPMPNSFMPADRKDTFHIDKANSKELRIKVMQGDNYSFINLKPASADSKSGSKSGAGDNKSDETKGK